MATFLGRGEGESFQKPSYYRSNRASSKNSRQALQELWRRRALVLWGWSLTQLLLYMQRMLETSERCRNDIKLGVSGQTPERNLDSLDERDQPEYQQGATCPTLETDR